MLGSFHSYLCLTNYEEWEKMIKTGLVSVTFRNRSPQDIISLVKKADLDAIEWGGDIHVPHGDLKQAKEVYKMSTDNGIKIASYGSYYFMNLSKDFEKVLETAANLRAPIIRVWAGKKGSADVDDNERKIIIDESQLIAEQAKEYNIKIAYEYHNNTLTDTNQSACKLLQEVNHPNIFTYWQIHPNISDIKNRINSISGIKKYLLNIHINAFELENEWLAYLNIISKFSGIHYALIEFVKNNETLDDFFSDAAKLKKMIAYIGENNNE